MYMCVAFVPYFMCPFCASIVVLSRKERSTHKGFISIASLNTCHVQRSFVAREPLLQQFIDIHVVIRLPRTTAPMAGMKNLNCWPDHAHHGLQVVDT